MEADLYTPPASGADAPTTPSASNRTFYESLQRLLLDVETIVPIHGRPGLMSEFLDLIGPAQ